MLEKDYTKDTSYGSWFYRKLTKEYFLQIDRNDYALIVNPVIKDMDVLKSTYEEGCLSVPNQFAEIDRPSECEVEYLDYNSKKNILKVSGLLATCIQHEMDHLEGILFIDYLSKLKKTMIIKKLSKQKDKVDRIVV